MAAFFADYRWSKGEPKGVSPIDDPTRIEHFRLLYADGGVRLEQFDQAGKFVRLIYCPQDKNIAAPTVEFSDDHRQKVRRSDDGAVRLYDEYEWPDGIYSEEVYPAVKVSNEHGRLIAQHRPQRVSESAWDIHVFDALGKQRVVLHHADGITEEWME